MRPSIFLVAVPITHGPTIVPQPTAAKGRRSGLQRQQHQRGGGIERGLRVSICAARPGCPHLELPQIRHGSSRRKRRRIEEAQHGSLDQPARPPTFPFPLDGRPPCSPEEAAAVYACALRTRRRIAPNTRTHTREAKQATRAEDSRDRDDVPSRSLSFIHLTFSFFCVQLCTSGFTTAVKLKVWSRLRCLCS